MGRPLSGSLYRKGERWYVSIRVGDRRPSFALPLGLDEAQANERKGVLVNIATRLRERGQHTLIESLLEKAAESNEKKLRGVLTIVEGLLDGREKLVRPTTKADFCNMTFREFADLWLSGELHRRFRDHVKDIDHSDNESRLRQYVFPVIGHIPVRDISIDHAELVMGQPNLPERSRRHVAQALGRVINLAVFPGKALPANPLPKGWLPKQKARKAMTFLYPREEAILMGTDAVPLVKRVLIGFLIREGCRASEAASLEWADLELDHQDGGGAVNLVENKTDDPRAWALDTGVAEALRRWRQITGPTGWVFPARLMRGSPRRNQDKSVFVGKLADELREYLIVAGVTRAGIFRRDESRQPLRAHDLRASFITINLAQGKSESWVTTRTGHKSSWMVAKYTRQATTSVELKLGSFAPLHKAIPELAARGGSTAT